jgi:hypothetical protein
LVAEIGVPRVNRDPGPGMCACGRPLHYTDVWLWRVTEEFVAKTGMTHIPVRIERRTWMVQRHFINLHGLQGWTLPHQGWQEVFMCPACNRISYNPEDLAKHYCGACHAFFL